MDKRVFAVVFAASFAAFSTTPLTAQYSAAKSPELSDVSHLTAEDKDFLIVADVDNRTQMALGKLAETKSRNKYIQEYGQALAMDHRNNQDQLDDLARKYQITLSGTLDLQHENEFDRFYEMNEPAFDREFVSQMVLDPQKAIQLFKNMAQTADDLPVRAYAGNTYPILQKHLDRAKELLSVLSSEGTPALPLSQ